MAYEAPTLDTSSRQKLAQTIQALTDAGLSMDEIMSYFNSAQTAGRQSLQDYYNVAGTNIGLQFEPQMEQARDFLGANPILADSGYSNRLNRQLQTDLYSRIAGDFGQRAAEESGRNTELLRSLYGRRAALRSGLTTQGYGNVQKKQKTGEKILAAGAQIGGAALGGYLGKPSQAAQGTPQSSQLTYNPYLSPNQYPSYMRRNTLNRDF